MLSEAERKAARAKSLDPDKLRRERLVALTAKHCQENTATRNLWYSQLKGSK